MEALTGGHDAESRGILLGRPGPGRMGDPDNTRLGPDPEPPGIRLDALLAIGAARIEARLAAQSGR